MKRDAENSTKRSFSVVKLSLLALYIALFVFSVLLSLEERSTKISSEIDRAGQAVARNLTETLRLSVENLRSVSNLVIFFENLDYPTFRELTAQNFEADTGLLIIEWQPVVPAAERERFVELARRRGLPEFRLWEPGDEGEPVSASPRPEHVPVYFMHSRAAETDISTLGLDLAWSEQRMESKWEARDTGRARASSLFHVVTGPESGFRPLGFAITLPIYEPGYVPENLEKRREAFLGYMAGVYSLEDVISGPTQEIRAQGFNIEIHDRVHGLESENRLQLISGPASRFNTDIGFDLFGQELRLKLVATDRFVREQFDWLWLLLPMSVALFGLMALLLLRRLEDSNQQLTEAHKTLEALNARLSTLSLRDPLTDMYNRSAFSEKLELEMSRVSRNRQPASLLMLDLDHFKDVNDRWGHQSGDSVLIEFSRICHDEARDIDIVARLGGEEFAIILSNTTSEDALRFAERLRQRVEDTAIRLEEDGAQIKITVSIGISTNLQSLSEHRWIEQADKALYLAKQSGRNCVRVYQ